MIQQVTWLNNPIDSLLSKPKLMMGTRDLRLVVRNNSIKKLNTVKSRDFIGLYLFKLFMILSLSPYSKYTRPHAIFSIMFMDHTRRGSVTLNLKRCFMRWQGTYALLYNLFYYSQDLLIFGHKLFKIDILALNSTTCPSINTFFKYSTSFAHLKDSIYGSNVSNLFRLLKCFRIETAFVSDMANHEKTALNLKKADVYTIGIITFSSNPWVLSYPIPTHSDGMFAQYYFIRYLYHIQQQASFSRFKQLHDVWSKF